MRSLTPLACVALVALAFAGCADDPERYPDGVPETTTTTSDGETSSSASATTTSSSQTTTGAPGNRPPTATMSVAVNGTNATFTLNGTDPDGDALSWELDFGDGNSTNGTSLPANATHAYTGNATNLTAVLTVTDGDLSTSFNATVALGGGAKGSVVYAGHITGPDAFAAAGEGCVFAVAQVLAPAPGDMGHLYQVEASTHGWAFAFDLADMNVDFTDSAGTVLGSGSSGTVPAGAAMALVCSAGPGAVDADYQLILTEP